MQYAEVLTEQKTKIWDATFDYEIGPETLPYLRVGSIVEVPFGKKVIEGVVVGLKRTLPLNIKNIRQIKRILQPNLVVSKEELEFSKWMASYYVTSWSEAFFTMLPPIPKKTISEKMEFQNEFGDEDKNYILVEKDLKRYDYYLEVLKKNKIKNKSVWLVFSDMKKLKNFLEIKKVDLKNFSTIEYTSSDNITTRFTKWQKIRSGNYDLLVGSRMALLCRPTNVGTIIVDDSTQSGHQEDQSPRYHSLDIIRYWRKMGIKTLCGDILPSLEQLVEAKNKEAVILSKKMVRPDCEVELVDMNKEKRLISLPLERELEKTVENNKTMVIFLAKKGMGSITKCQNCGYIFNCPNCELPLKYNAAKKMMTCFKCDYSQANANSCPKCHSDNIMTFGLGLEKIATILKKYVADYPIIILDKENELPENPGKGIYVATQALFRYNLQMESCVLIDADLSLTKPNYNTSEEAFYLFFRLLTMASEKLLIQTHEVESEILNAIKYGKYQSFLNNMLRERFENKYPPYGHLVKIEIVDKNEKKGSDRIEKLKNILSDNLLNVQLIGPNSTLKKNEFIYTLILKSPREFGRVKMRKLIGSDVKIEFDPENLL